MTAQGQSSGVDTQAELWHVHTFQGDLVVRVESFTAEDDALAALRGTPTRPAENQR